MVGKCRAYGNVAKRNATLHDRIKSMGRMLEATGDPALASACQKGDLKAVERIVAQRRSKYPS